MSLKIDRELRKSINVTGYIPNPCTASNRIFCSDQNTMPLYGASSNIPSHFVDFVLVSHVEVLSHDAKNQIAECCMYTPPISHTSLSPFSPMLSDIALQSFGPLPFHHLTRYKSKFFWFVIMMIRYSLARLTVII